jgi:hypothetical protein
MARILISTPRMVEKLLIVGDSAVRPAGCCAQQTGMHKLVVEALLIAIYSTWGTSKYLYT